MPFSPPNIELEAIARQSVEASREDICAYFGNIGRNSGYFLHTIFLAVHPNAHPALGYTRPRIIALLHTRPGLAQYSKHCIAQCTPCTGLDQAWHYCIIECQAWSGSMQGVHCALQHSSQSLSTHSKDRYGETSN